MIKLNRKTLQLIRRGILNSFCTEELYTCPHCKKPVLMVWKEEDYPVRIAFCNCIVWQSHVLRIPNEAGVWAYYAYKYSEEFLNKVLTPKQVSELGE